MNRLSKLGSFCSWEWLAFWAFLGGGTYIVLFPPKYSAWITTVYLAPWLLLWLAYSWRIVQDKARRTEIILMGTILVLGAVNVIGSDDWYKSYQAMRLFLLTGIMALWISMFLMADPRRRNIFAWFCCGCLALVISNDILAYLTKGSGSVEFSIFFFNPIPLGTMVILLSLGPAHLLFSESPKLKIAGGVMLSLGFLIILLTQKRGTYLAVSAMALIWIACRRNRWGLLAVAALVAMGLLIPFKDLSTYKSLDQEIPSHFNILNRQELYPFAWHVYKKHPLMGIGLRPFTHEKYLSDYQQHNPEFKYFVPTVKRLQTFDNMLLTAFVELGTLLTLAYLGLVIYILVNYCRKVRPFAGFRGEDLFRLLPLLGFAIHSLTYDSLLFPNVSWLFHVQLGILAGFSRP